MEQSAGDKKFGLSGAALKYIALFLMCLDHIYIFTPWARFPALHMAGRLALPIFFFLVAVGYTKTRNRPRYLLRLYLFSVATALIFGGLCRFFPRADGLLLTMNIFATLFYVVLFLLLADLRAALLKDGRKNRAILLLCGAAAALALFFFLPKTDSIVINALLPNPFFVEGGLVLILFGVGMRYLMDSTASLSIWIALFSLLFFPFYDLSTQSIFVTNCQWLMVLSIPLILSYNGERGRQNKHFFYLFYPLHLVILYISPQFFK